MRSAAAPGKYLAFFVRNEPRPGKSAIGQVCGSTRQALPEEHRRHLDRLAPVIMALATIALILAEYTPVFDILSYPFVPLLNLLQIPEAAAVAPTFLIGFPDQLMAAVVGGATVTSEYSRIVIAIVSLNQLIYMSETGALLMKSSLSINFKQLVIIFLERTIITLPFAMIAAHLLTA